MKDLICIYGGIIMDFYSISNINSYVKQLTMKNEMYNRMGKIRKSNSKAANADASSQVKETNDSGPDRRLSSIISKMQSGIDLSPSDWSYLHDNYPEIYEKAMRQAAEKKAYEEELDRCETKEEARMIHMNQLSKTKAELDAGLPAAEVIETLNMVTNVYNNFVVSEKYSKMAENQAEIERNESEDEKDIAELEKPREKEPVEEEPVEEEPVEKSTKEGQNGTEENVRFMPEIDTSEPEAKKAKAEDAAISARSRAAVTADAYKKPISTARKIVDFQI
jgi:hypothetical protein